MSLALSALFSFCRAAGEVMCASQIFIEDPGSSLSHFFREREGDGFLKCRTYENSATDFPLDDHIRLSGVNEDLITVDLTVVVETATCKKYIL